MKYSLISALLINLFSFNITRAADTARPYGDFILIVHGSRIDGSQSTNRQIVASDKLVWLSACRTGHVECLFGKEKYFVRITMRNEQGQEIRKTLLGSVYGTDFDSVNEKTTYLNPSSAVIHAVPPESFYYPISGKLLDKPEDLFIFPKKGLYSLTVEMQMFVNVTNSIPWTQRLVHLPPVTLDVEKK